MKGLGTMPFRLDEIGASFGSKTYENSERPSECFIEVTFPKQCYLNYVMFQNFYTYSITIKQAIVDNGTTKWKTVLRNYKLMKNPHFEGDAQNWHLIKTEKFNDHFDTKQLKMLRIYLSQPSPNWIDFHLKKLTFYTVRLTESILKYDVDGKEDEKVKEEDFKSIKEKFQANMKLLASTTNTEISKYDDKIDKMEEVHKIDFN